MCICAKVLLLFLAAFRSLAKEKMPALIDETSRSNRLFRRPLPWQQQAYFIANRFKLDANADGRIDEDDVDQLDLLVNGPSVNDWPSPLANTRLQVYP